MLDLGSNINIKQYLDRLMNRKDAVLNIAVVIIALLIGRAVNGNLYQKVTSLQHQIETQKKVNVSVDQLQQLKVKFDDYKTSMPEDINPFTVVEKINKLASETGIRLISVVPAEAKDKAVYLEYPLTIKLENNYFELANFIKKIEDLKIFKIINLDIVSQSASEEINKTTGQKLSVNMALLSTSLKK